MKLASLKHGRDGRLVVVSRDLARCVAVPEIAATLQEALDRWEALAPKLQAISKTGYNERIYVRGDSAAGYGTVMKVMARISSAGFKNIGLVTQQEKTK